MKILRMKSGNNFLLKDIRKISYCKCGNYKPRSTKGVIDKNCRNCGGKKRPILVK